MTRKTLLIIGLIGVLGSIHLATLREGQEWGDDFSLYVAHARNLAEGRPYAETGYVYNPAIPVLSPRTYPPVFPLLLVPVYLLFGMNLTAMKVFVVLLFTAMLGVLSMLFQKRLPLPYVLGCLALFALNPYVWQHKDRLLSETPFMLFAYSALLLVEKGQESGRRAWLWGLLAGVAAYLAFGTRTIGFVLVPSVLICDWWRRRQGTIQSAEGARQHERGVGVYSTSCILHSAMILAFLTGVAVQKSLLIVEGSYLDQLVFDPALFARTGLSLVAALGHFLENGYSKTGRLILFSCVLGPASWAVLTRMRGRCTVWEFFALFNYLVLVFWPAADYEMRFLLPILPLFFLWAAEGLHRLALTTLWRWEMPAATALTLALLLSYAGWYSRADLGPVHDGVSAPESVALFDWVQNQTKVSDVFLFPKPRALALYTGRRALSHRMADDPKRLVRTLQEYGVTHVIVNQSSPLTVFRKSGRLIETLLAEEPEGFDKVYENPAFRVYRLRTGTLARR